MRVQYYTYIHNKIELEHYYICRSSLPQRFQSKPLLVQKLNLALHLNFKKNLSTRRRFSSLRVDTVDRHRNLYNVLDIAEEQLVYD